LLAVTQFIRFHSLGGVLWDNPDRLDKVRVGTALIDYSAWMQAGKLEPVDVVVGALGKHFDKTLPHRRSTASMVATSGGRM
jgi:hypothetical protein